MRNVIRNILTNWSNIFGRQLVAPVTGLPYTFTTSGSPVAITVWNGLDNGNLIISTSYTYGGGTHSGIYAPITPGNSYSINVAVDPGTEFTIQQQQGVCVKLEVDGIVIFDNQ